MVPIHGKTEWRWVTDRYGHSRVGWGWNDSLENLIASTLPVQSGPAPGLLRDIAALYDRSCSQYWNFPILFEAKVAHWMGHFLRRYVPARDLVSSTGGVGWITGSITIDGSEP